MKKQNFQQSLLAVGVIAALGLSATAIAAESGSVTPQNAPTIKNVATAAYSVGGVEQPAVESNEVIVSISPRAEFSLVGTQKNPTDDINEDQPVFPGESVTFINKLTNEGNQEDTYTLELKQLEGSSIIDGSEDDFDFTTVPNMQVKVFKDGEDPNTASPQRTMDNVASGSTVTLQPDEFAVITYDATAPETVKGGEKGSLTLTATSADITAINTADSASHKATLTNESQAVVSVPVFKIQKTATSGSINANKEGEQLSYEITVTNDGSVAWAADATNFLVQDTLPKGLVVADTDANITVSDDNGKATTAMKEGRQVVSVQGINLAKGESVTITIPVKVGDKAALLAAAAENANALENVADVYDNYDDSEVNKDSPKDADIHDSTDNTQKDKTRLPDSHDSDQPDQPGGDTPKEDADVTVTDRGLTLSEGSDAELPPTSGDNGNVYSHDLTNTGNSPEKGLTFEITDEAGQPLKNEADDPLKIKDVKFTEENGTVHDLTPDGEGKYTIPVDLPAGKKGTISYEVETEGADPGEHITKVKVTPAASTDPAIPTPNVTPESDTTKVKTLKLDKKQAPDVNCDNQADKAFSKDEITNATPGQCIVYQIVATNQFDGTKMSNVTISDSASRWSAGANYVASSINAPSAKTTSEPSVSDGTDSGKVSATFDEVAAGATAEMQFTIKLK